MNSIKIRKGQPADIKQIKAYLIDLWTEHTKNEPDLLDEEKVRNVDVDGYYKKCLEAHDKVTVFVAEEDNKIVGYLKAEFEEIPSFNKYPKILYLDDLYVAPDYRRKGVARLLIDQAENIAKEKGIRRIQAKVYTFNTGMQKLLESMGYHLPHSTWDKTLE